MSDGWDRFLAAREYGYPAQLAVAAYLNAHGIKVTVPALVYHATPEEAGDFTDEGDVLDENGQSFEVQRRTVSFAGRSTFPWSNMLTMPCEKITQLAKQGRTIRGCFAVSADLAIAAAVNYAETRQFWFERIVQQQTYGTIKAAFFCPVEHVKFVRLPQIERGDHHCHCGAYAALSVDNGKTWLCPEHALAKRTNQREE